MKPGTIVDWIMRGNLLSVRLDYADVPVNAHIDSAGKALIDPPERENLPDVCRTCDQLEHDKTVAIVNSPTYAWRHLGLVEPDGTPTRRGMIFSFFHGGEGLAVAVALEDETYPIDELVFDLANIRAGPRFAGEDAPMGGRLGILCQRVYRRADYPGYLTMGVPVQYGAGASEVVRALVADPRSKHKLTNELLRHGDIERALVEWRSILRHIVLAPAYPLSRWTELKAAAEELIDKTASPTSAVDLATLVPLQQRAGGSDALTAVADTRRTAARIIFGEIQVLMNSKVLRKVPCSSRRRHKLTEKFVTASRRNHIEPRVPQTARPLTPRSRAIICGFMMQEAKSRETGRSAGARVPATARRGARLCRVPFSIASPTRKSPSAVSHKNPARQTWLPNPTPRFLQREYSLPSIPIRALLST